MLHHLSCRLLVDAVSQTDALHFSAALSTRPSRWWNGVEEGVRLAAELGSTVHALYVIDAFEAKIVPITGEQDEAREEHASRTRSSRPSTLR